jgi:hypothetical protein
VVAYTTPDCLPYFQGTDSPCVNTGTVCEPSTVDCDFAAVVEAKLDEFDDVVEVVSSPPMAWVETLVPMVVTVGTLSDDQVIFDTVRVDSDNMVNLDENPSAITITRTGLYQIFLYCRALTVLGGANFLDLVMNTTAPPGNTLPTFPQNSVTCDQAIQLNAQEIAPQVSMVTYYQEGQVITASLNANGITSDAVATIKISMGVVWLGDLA